MTAYLLIHELACIALFVTVFCRLIKTTSNTHAAIRLSFWALGTVAALGIVWPLMAWPLYWFAPLITLAIVQVQLVTSHFWSAGPPHQFRKR